MGGGSFGARSTYDGEGGGVSFGPSGRFVWSHRSTGFASVDVHEERVIGAVFFDEAVRVIIAEEATVCTVASGRLLPSFNTPEVNATVGLDVADLIVMIFTAPEEAKEVVEATACRDVGRLMCSKIPLPHHRRRVVRLLQFLGEERHPLINSPRAVQGGRIRLVV